jgi:glycosyltransferase involved in cell wall biosynthesis
MIGVSFVVPVHNGASHLRETLASIVAQADGRPMEIVVVEDGSRDGSAALLDAFGREHRLTIVRGPRRGAAAAINAGLRQAAHGIVCQVDQDVVLQPGWVAELVAAFEDPHVAAAQGCYTTDPAARLFARVMALDLAERYSHLRDGTDHVCTGNTAYRASALREVGLLDERVGYGYDNDLSYRLQAAGYRLVFRRRARSRHYWREGILGYLSQQYGFGYGRLDVVARHPSRCRGDMVSPVGMMAHPALMAVALCLVGLGATTAGMALVGVLAVERAVAGARAWRLFGDRAALLFPVVHLARDLAWVAAMTMWAGRRVLRRPVRPGDSMRGRAVAA